MNPSTLPDPASGLQRWARRITLLALIVAIAAVLAMLLPGPLYRFGVLALKNAFSTITFGFALGLLASALAVVGVLLTLPERTRVWRLRAWVALVLGLIAFVPPLLLVHKAKSVPAIHDISTDTVNPPAFQALLPARAKSPNSSVYGGAEVASKQHTAYPDIQTLQFDSLPANTFAAALSVARATGWQVAAQVPAEGRIEATATTFWFGFKDDVVIRVLPEGTGTRVDIRSESRVGVSDVGANAARIRKFSSKLRETLGGH